MNSPDTHDREIFRQAAQLLVRLHSGDATRADHEACARWREQSDAHRRTWRLAEQLRRQFESVPAGVGDTLREGARGSAGASAGGSAGRRRALKALSWFALAAPAGWMATRMPWQEWRADYRTATGEQRDIRLADGTAIILNTNSAVDVAFSPDARRIMLRGGEVMVLPAQGAQALRAALLVQTAEGAVEAHGPQFSVRQERGLTRVAAFRGAARVLPAAGGALTLEQGHCCAFTRHDASTPQQFDARQAMWTRGLLYADNMRLADLAAELSRYRHGVLRCADDVADLRVSGIYQLNNADATLALLERTYPIRLRSITPYWTMIESRAGASDGQDVLSGETRRPMHPLPNRDRIAPANGRA
jgi:transmembrane sensor